MTRPASPQTSSPPLASGVAEAISYASSHGIVVSQALHAPPGTSLSHAPMTYLPSPLPSSCHTHALRITPALNSLVSRIAADHAYLRRTLAETAAADAEFTGRLLAMLEVARKEEGVELAISRFDYFVHQEDQIRELRMVEMNCIAASFACLGARTSRMHRHLSRHPAVGAGIDPGCLPANDADKEVARGIAAAHAQYGKLYGVGKETVAVMVVQPGDRNAYDQDLLRIALWDEHEVEMVRLSLAEIGAEGRLGKDGCLRVSLSGREGQSEVSVVYFRAGYTPEDYPSEKEWAAREMLERSTAANCPSVAMQLVGTKKIQQVLDREGEVERFVGKEQARDIRSTFARQYSLSKEEGGEEAARMAIERPGDFVLKPQREGGGNNFYGEEMKKALEGMSAEERSAYVLMERIRPVVVKNVLIRGGKFQEAEIVSEFGVYGVHVCVKGEQVENYAAGTLLRSKAASQDDGGVAAGVAVLDSAMLVD